MKLPCVFMLAVIALDTARGADLFVAVRNGDLSTLRRDVTRANVNARGARGVTLLMQAAAFGNIETTKFLIQLGADVNAKNDFAATALLWSARDPEKARLLIANGADVNAQSKQGRTPLIMAAMRDGGSDIVKLLLDKGADPNAKDTRGYTALSFASEAGDVESIRLLIAKGADVNSLDQEGQSMLVHASMSREPEAVRLLIEKGVDPNIATTWYPSVKNGQIQMLQLVPLDRAVSYGPVEMVRLLLKAGAKVNVKDNRGYTPLMFAVSSEAQKPEIVRTLIGAGADVNARSAYGETALDWAERFGYAESIAALREAGAKRGNVNELPKRNDTPPRDVATAITRSVELLQKSNAAYFIRGGCVGCHHQPIIARAVQAARTGGIAVDETAAHEMTLQLKAQWASSQEEFLQSLNPGGGQNRLGEMLLGVHASGIPADRTIDAAVIDLLESQKADGRWFSSEEQARPPMNEGWIGATARAIRVAQVYTIPARRSEFEARVQRAVAALKRVTPSSSDDCAMRLLALQWGGAPQADVRSASRELLDLQREDGGWSGNRYLKSDAFSTSTALYALHEAGTTASDPVYRRGISYLLSTQYPDGSWYVRSRSFKFQPYFESDFPFGHDQWISAAATAWAVIALAPAVQKTSAATAALP